MSKYFILFSLCISFTTYAQYTEVINSNRPGESQGAFSVGKNVIQLEAGLHYGVDDHDLTGVKSGISGVDYMLRYGVWREELEVSLQGDFSNVDNEFYVGGEKQKISVRDFRSNTLGAKYLVYDPYKKRAEEGPNLYSWRANNLFQLRDLIPAVSVYAGVNLQFGSRPSSYPFFGEYFSSVSPKLAVITQNNWRGTAWVMNFIYDHITDDHSSFIALFTLTQSVSPQVSLFGEFETRNNHYYSDELLRMGGAYLFSKDLQIDLSGMLNFKDTPSRWQVGLGVSYRLDFHRDEWMEEESVEIEAEEPQEEVESDGK